MIAVGKLCALRRKRNAVMGQFILFPCRLTWVLKFSRFVTVLSSIQPSSIRRRIRWNSKSLVHLRLNTKGHPSGAGLVKQPPPSVHT